MIGFFKRWLIELLSIIRPPPRGTRLDISDLIDIDAGPAKHNNEVQDENNDRLGVN